MENLFIIISKKTGKKLFKISGLLLPIDAILKLIAITMILLTFLAWSIEIFILSASLKIIGGAAAFIGWMIVTFALRKLSPKPL